MKHIAFVLLASLAAASAAAKEETPLPKDLPPYGAEKPLPVPDIVKRTLPNGLTVWVVAREGIPKVDVVLAVRGGLAADGEGRDGLSSLLASLLTEGTAKRSSQQLAEDVQALGGSIGAGASPDGVILFGDAFVSNAAPLMEIVADVARNATFPEQEVALGKTNALQGLMASEATPSFLAERALTATIYGDHPYGRTTSTAASIEATTADALRAAHKQRFRPDRALLVIAGRVPARTAFDLAQKHFGDWRGSGTPLPDVPAVDAAPKRKLALVERAGGVQASVRVARPGVPATHDDAIPLALTNTVLGGGFSSRLYRNIREDKGYTYSPGASVRRLRAGGIVSVQAEVRNDVTAATLNEVLYEFDRLGTTDVSAEDLARAKRYFAGLYLFSNQLQSAVASALAGNWLVGLPPEYLGTYVAKAQAVTVAQVHDIGRKYYASRDQSIVIVGERKVLEKELTQFGEFGDYTH